MPSSVHALRHNAPRVQVQLFDEALCIGCHHFVLEQLVPTFEALGPSVLDLQVVPFGNAKIDEKSNSLECQHGLAECDANSYQQCAADIYQYASRYLPFVKCLYETLTMGHADDPFHASVFAGCAKQSALDWTSIKTCHDDTERAWKLQVEAFHMTPSEHKYVPWVVINGETIDMGQEDFDLFTTVCDLYTSGGGSHPACGDGSVIATTVTSILTTKFSASR